MNMVYLTSGPRGAGKTTYVRQIAESEVVTLLSRDEVLIELFGKTSLDRYTDDHHIAMNTLFERLGTYLKDDSDSRIILDCWNGFPSERRNLIRTLRELGAHKVFCMFFLVPVEVCVEWFFSKDDSKGYSKYGIQDDHALYYRQARSIVDDGFDGIQYIDPRQLLLKLEY